MNLKEIEEEFDEKYESIFKKHHSTNISAFIDSDGKNHYLLLKEDIKQFISTSITKLLEELKKEVIGSVMMNSSPDNEQCNVVRAIRKDIDKILNNK